MADRDQLNEITNTVVQEAAAVVFERPPPYQYGPVDDHGLKRRIPDTETEVASLDAWNAPDSRKKQVVEGTAYNQQPQPQQRWGIAPAGSYASSPSPASAIMGNPASAQGAPAFTTYTNNSTYMTHPPVQYNSNTTAQNSDAYGSNNASNFASGGYTGGTASIDGSTYRGVYAPSSNPYSMQPPASATNEHGAAPGYNSGPLAPPGMYGSVNGNSFASGEQDDVPTLPPRNCQCGIPCPPRVSQSAANTGRTFFACTKPRDDQTRCRFFEWADGLNSMAAVARIGDNAADRTHPSNTPGGGMGAAGGGSDACFKCGQSGHWSRDCPNRANGGGGGGIGGSAYRAGAGGGAAAGGGGGGGGGTCFSCGESGHWSRDCPKKGTSNSYNTGSGPGGGYGRGGGGGGYGGSYGGGRGGGGGGGAGGWNGGSKNMNCYKCGQPGHFSSSCPNSNAL